MRAVALAGIAYCATLAAGLWWRIGQAEARYVERQRQHDAPQLDDAPAKPQEPTSPKKSGRVEYAYRKDEILCDSEW